MIIFRVNSKLCSWSLKDSWIWCTARLTGIESARSCPSTQRWFSSTKDIPSPWRSIFSFFIGNLIFCLCNFAGISSRCLSESGGHKLLNRHCISQILRLVNIYPKYFEVFYFYLPKQFDNLSRNATWSWRSARRSKTRFPRCKWHSWFRFESGICEKNNEGLNLRFWQLCRTSFRWVRNVSFWKWL